MTAGQDHPPLSQPQVDIEGNASIARDLVGGHQLNVYVLGSTPAEQRDFMALLRGVLSTEGTKLLDSADAEPGEAPPRPAAEDDHEPALLVQAADGRTLRLSAADAGALREVAAAGGDLDDYLAATIADQRCAELARRWVPLAGTLTEQARPAGWTGIEPELVALVAEGEGAGRRIRRERLADVTEAMQRPAWVLLGEPGGGKTTTLSRLLVRCATERLKAGTGLIPLFLPLAAYQDQPTPLDFVRERWQEALPNAPVTIDELLVQGQLLLLCDAINEMPFVDDDDRRKRIRAWEGFAERSASAGNRFVFSCRTRDYTEVLGLPQVEIARLDDDRVQRFLRNYLPAELAAAAWPRLNGKPLLELVRNPFYLWILCWLIANDEAWPASRADLLAGFVLHRLDHEARRGHADWPGRALLERALSGLADGMQALGEGTRLPRAEAVARLAAAAAKQDGQDADGAAPNASRPDASAPGGDTLLRLGLAASLLEQEGKGERAQVRFYHHQLQEYFAARALLAADAAGTDLARRWRVPCRRREMPDPGPLRPDEPLPPPPGTGWEEPTLIAAALLAAEDAPAAPGELASAAAAFIGRVRAHNPVLAARCLTQPGLPQTALPVMDAGAVDGLLEGSADNAADTSAIADSEPLAVEVAATRAALLAQQRGRRNHRRARIAAGDALGRLGDPRFRIIEVDGIRFIPPPLVTVPAGVVRIGSGAMEALRLLLRGWYQPDERPAHRLHLPAFRIGRFPVTNAEYRCFVDAGGYAEDRWWDTDAARAWRRGELKSGRVDTIMEAWRQVKADPDLMRRQGWPEYQIKQWEKFLAMDEDAVREAVEQSDASRPMDRPAFWDDPRFDNPSQPVVGVNWLEARAYGLWLGDCLRRAAGAAGGDLPWGACRLPTEAEWERAARAGAWPRRRYPWPGRAGFDSDRANCVEGQVLATTPVGSYPAGASPLGIEDLAGNCWEWCASRYGPYPIRSGDGRDDPAGNDRRVLRGGAWGLDRRFARAADRNRGDPGDFNDNVGFRLVLSLADADF